ncbi:MAG: FlgD immunoglobulin-like domain containing protein [Candidatus Marinimicrobia bacterium]|nr:FlgD immunoglobulin-like domain containing protein [Candidatus Neomarinimicrobiota bacterium]
MQRTITILGLLFTALQAQYPAEWVINPPDYEHTMTVTSIVEINGETSGNAADALAVFYNEECRGVSEPILVGEIYMHFLMVYSNDSGLDLTFKAWDSEVGNVVDLDQTLNFESGDAVGTVGEPYQFSGTNPISYLDAVDDYTVQIEDEEGSTIAVLENDVIGEDVVATTNIIEDPIHGYLEVLYPSAFRYIPPENFFGQDSFQYELSTEYSMDSAWVYIEVTAVNDPPDAFGLITPEDGRYIVEVDATDIEFSWEVPVDPEADPITYSLYIKEGETLITSWTPMSNTEVFNVEELPREVWLDWHVIAYDAWGWTASLDTFAIKVSEAVNVDRDQLLPQSFSLSQNYPNPFNPVTTIGFGVPEVSHVKINVYNLRNQIVRTLVDQNLSQGYHQVEWNSLDDQGKPMASGTYLVVLESGNYREVNKILMLK